MRRAVLVVTFLFTLATAATAEKSAADETPPPPPRPQNLTPPVISGSPEPGKILTASPGTWTESPTSYAYEWESCSEISSPPPSQGQLACSPVAEATTATFAVTRFDSGRIRVKVTAFHGSLASFPEVSAATDRVGLHLVPTMSASAGLQPMRMPGGRSVPTTLDLGFESSALNPPGVPTLTSISFELSRHVNLHPAGLTSCSIKKLYTSGAEARRRCTGAIVGHGKVDSEVLIGREEVAVEGSLTAFYDLENERARVLGQVITDGPSPLTYVLPFQIAKEQGQFGTELSIPQMRVIHGIVIRGGYPYTFPNGYGRISRLSLSLKRSFASSSRQRSFITASCPARRGSVAAEFPLLRATLDYAESGSTLTSSVEAHCKVNG